MLRCFVLNGNDAPKSVKLSEAFRFWLKLGFISFGGPAGQIAIMHQELVERRRWISDKRFLHALNYCMMLPGPEAQQLATYIGWLMHRTWGGIVAGGLFVLPSLILLLSLSWLYMAFGHVTLVEGLFYGIKPAVIAIVVQALYRIAGRTLKNPLMWAIAAAAFLALFVLHAPFPLIVAAAAAVGAVAGRFRPALFAVTSAHTGAASEGAAMIDDTTPPPDHARFRWSRLAVIIVVGLVLWVGPLVAAGLALGWEHPVSRMGVFFSKAALLTFGGAYAVLPYVYQGAVTQYGWLSAPQMIDGLALGETTPGPLIMVVTFVAFVGGWNTAWLGPEMRVAAAMIAAVWVTWFTFLPSFLFIFAGGPLIESTHNRLSFTAPLTAITAAVVGVILNLALFFGYHVLWPKGFGGPFDALSAALAVAAAVALIRFRANVIAVIAVCAVIGLVLRHVALV
jgi:chromate transporter